MPARVVSKVREGSPHALDALSSGRVGLVVNTTVGAGSVRDSYSLRRQAVLQNLPYFTTMAAALAACDALEATSGSGAAPAVRSLQEWGST